MWKTEQLFIIFFFTYHSQKYFAKVFYYLPKTWLSLINVTYHSQKRILSVFYFVEFPLGMWVNKRIKPTQKQQAFLKHAANLKNTMYTSS